MEVRPGSARPPLLIVQPTSFCNLDCSYCYVAGRDDTTRMTSQTLQRVAAHSMDYFERADVVFHAGEPLTVGLDWFRDAVAIFDAAAARSGREIRFGVQTNGVLVNDEWAAFFVEHDFMVGVSLDGPADIHDSSRLTLGGRGSHARSERGFRLLRDAGLNPSVLAVLSEAGLRRPDALYDYFTGLGVERLGFNVEDATARTCQSSEA